MTGDQNWRDRDASTQVTPQLPPPGGVVVDVPPFFQTKHGGSIRDTSIRAKLMHLMMVVSFSLRRALIPSALIAASIFAASTYLRVQSSDAKITMAYVKAEYAIQLGQPDMVVPLVDHRGKLHRISADRLVRMSQVSELSLITELRLKQNAALGLGAAFLWLVYATLTTARRIL